MFWTIETNNGIFQGEKIKPLMEKIVQYFAIQNEDFEINSIVLTNEVFEKERIFCDDAVKKFHWLIIDSVNQWKKEASRERLY